MTNHYCPHPTHKITSQSKLASENIARTQQSGLLHGFSSQQPPLFNLSLPFHPQHPWPLPFHPPWPSITTPPPCFQTRTRTGVLSKNLRRKKDGSQTMNKIYSTNSSPRVLHCNTFSTPDAIMFQYFITQPIVAT